MCGRGQISLYYTALMSYDKSSMDRLEAWRLDVQEDIHETEWEMACLKAKKQSINTRMKLLQHKWLMRSYSSPIESLVP